MSFLRTAIVQADQVKGKALFYWKVSSAWMEAWSVILASGTALNYTCDKLGLFWIKKKIFKINSAWQHSIIAK